MIAVSPGLESTSESQTANSFDLHVRDVVKVVFGDVVLRQSHAVATAPDWEIEILLLAINDALQPEGREDIRVTLSTDVKLKEHRRSVSVSDGQAQWAVLVVSADAPLNTVAFDGATLALDLSRTTSSSQPQLDLTLAVGETRAYLA